MNFLNFFSSNIDELKNQILTNQHLDERYFYTFNPLRNKPIIKLSDCKYSCPLVRLLKWRITKGLYYTLINSFNFGQRFGDSYQMYIGIYLNKMNLKNFKIYSEEKYGKQEKRTVDWIVEDNNCLLFIECKTKRLIHKAIEEILDKNILDDQLDLCAKMIVQVYKTYLDYKDNLYPQIKFKSKQVYILIFTLEDWLISDSPLYEKYGIPNLLKENVSKLLISKNIDINILKEAPFFVYSTYRVERDIQIINHHGINKYFKHLKAKTLHDLEKNTTFINFFEEEIEIEFLKPLNITVSQ